jgi:hypothetical protein
MEMQWYRYNTQALQVSQPTDLSHEVAPNLPLKAASSHRLSQGYFVGGLYHYNGRCNQEIGLRFALQGLAKYIGSMYPGSDFPGYG